MVRVRTQFPQRLFHVPENLANSLLEISSGHSLMWCISYLRLRDGFLVIKGCPGVARFSGAESDIVGLICRWLCFING